MSYTQSSLAGLSLIDIDEESITELRKARYILQPAVFEMLDKLYVRVLADAESNKIPCDISEVDHLRQQLKAHWREALFRGKYDDAYRERTVRICRAHARVGLTPDWYIDSYSQILCQLIELILEQNSANGRSAISLVQTLSRIFFLDMDLMVNSYLGSKDESMQQMLLRSTELREDIWKFSTDLNTVATDINTTAETLAEDIHPLAVGASFDASPEVRDWARAQRHFSQLLEQARQLRNQISGLEEHLRQLPLNEKLYLSDGGFFSWLKSLLEKRYHRNKTSLTP